MELHIFGFSTQHAQQQRAQHSIQSTAFSTACKAYSHSMRAHVQAQQLDGKVSHNIGACQAVLQLSVKVLNTAGKAYSSAYHAKHVVIA